MANLKEEYKKDILARSTDEDKKVLLWFLAAINSACQWRDFTHCQFSGKYGVTKVERTWSPSKELVALYNSKP